MSIAGALATDAGIRDLSKIMTIAESHGEQFETAIVELASFFVRHLETGLLPVTKSTHFPTPTQQHVYGFIDSFYQKFVTLMNFGEFDLTDEISDALMNVFIADKCKLLKNAVVDVFLTTGFSEKYEPMHKLPEFQLAVYETLITKIDEHRNIILDVLTREFPECIKCEAFDKLFAKFVTLELTDKELTKLFDNFDAVLSRNDDKLVTYNFLYDNFVNGAKYGAMALPFLVSVSVDMAVDVTNIYSHAFKTITVESLSISNRARYLDTLTKILCSKKLQAKITTAFAVKLSRILPAIPVEAQQDVMSLLQHLVRAHTAVADLLNPIDGPISNVDGDIDECEPQTLWEALAMRNSAIVHVADTANKLGQFHLPPNFGSFDLKDAVESCKKPKYAPNRGGMWLNGLDRTVWSFH